MVEKVEKDPSLQSVRAGNIFFAHGNNGHCRPVSSRFRQSADKEIYFIPTLAGLVYNVEEMSEDDQGDPTVDPKGNPKPSPPTAYPSLANVEVRNAIFIACESAGSFMTWRYHRGADENEVANEVLRELKAKIRNPRVRTELEQLAQVDEESINQCGCCDQPRLAALQ